MVGFRFLPFLRVGAWRSPVAHLLWEQGVAGSNPVAPTIFCLQLSPVVCLVPIITQWGASARDAVGPMVEVSGASIFT